MFVAMVIPIEAGALFDHWIDMNDFPTSGD